MLVSTYRKREGKSAAPKARRSYQSGMSLAEIIVASAVLLLVFGGLLAFFQTAVQLIGNAKAKAGAVALANESMEYIRSLPYDSVGTVNGIPDGVIPQNATTTLNGVVYTERVLIEYVDSPDDGEGAYDSNGILADYKRAKVEYSWTDRGVSKTIYLVSNIVPNGVESTEGGGTLTVNVFDASASPVPGAEVHVYNDTGTTTVDVTRYTNYAGIAQFAGAPEAANYSITVTGDNMSTDQTYSATIGNPNPSTPPVAVIAGQVSTMNFQIDTLSDLAINTVGLPTVESFTDYFTDSNSIENYENVVVGGGEVVLSGAPDYVSSGSLTSVAVTPNSFNSWDSATFVADVPSETGMKVSVYSVIEGVYSLVPDTDLPGNSAGFTSDSISLTALDPVSYPGLALGATLTSSNASSSPALTSWSIGYVVFEPPIGNVAFSFTGAKTIGTTADESPVYKYEENLATDASGSLSLTNLEWDLYDLSLAGNDYVITEACNPLPYALDPGVSESLKLTLIDTPTRSLHVYVLDTNGDPISGASVSVSRTGFSDSGTTSSCGQIFFDSGLVSATDYTLDVTAPGYTDSTESSISISGNETWTVTLVTS